MSPLAVKICGITTYEDGLAALRLGADLLGFNFYHPSPRCLSPEACAGLVSELRALGIPFRAVGVFVNHSTQEIETLLEACGLDLAQLSGNEQRQTLDALGNRAFKALRPVDQAGLHKDLQRYPARAAAPAYLIDANRPGEFGGTGNTADWTLAARLAQQYSILLAGGLNPANVGAAIQQVHPWGVDVASGVEHAPGRKDPAKMAAFLQACRDTDEAPASRSKD